MANDQESDDEGLMQCRIGCGACCIAPSISSPIPGMPDGKPAGVRCVQLTADNRCAIFGSPDRPAICGRFQPRFDMCGTTTAEALEYLSGLEILTRTDVTAVVGRTLCQSEPVV